MVGKGYTTEAVKPNGASREPEDDRNNHNTQQGGGAIKTVVSSGSSIGAKGMLFASKAMALAGLDLLTKPDVLAQAKADFDKARNGKDYVTPLPDDAIPQ